MKLCITFTINFTKLLGAVFLKYFKFIFDHPTLKYLIFVLIEASLNCTTEFLFGATGSYG